jgi:hypothetical protein
MLHVANAALAHRGDRRVDRAIVAEVGLDERMTPPS